MTRDNCFDTTSSSRFTARNVPVRTLIYFAYDLQAFQLVGGPAWMTSERFETRQAKFSRCKRCGGRVRRNIARCKKCSEKQG